MTKDKLFKTDRILILIAGLVFAAITLATIIKDEIPDWKYYQSEFRAIATDVVGIDKASKTPRGIQQIWVDDLDRVDRCITCHQGIFWPGFEREPQPYATHPDLEIFKTHPAKEYGCTICHGGQGYAVDMASAHGFVKFWEEPLLAGAVAADYNISDKNAMIETNCNVCHRYERETEGMPYINLGKDLIQDKACWGCHIINGSGGTIGPDLTHSGEKHSEGYDWSNYSGFKSVFNWHFQHFDEPAGIVPETVMPKMGLQTKERHALTMLMMSWRDDDMPAQYIPGFKQEEQLHPEEIQKRDELLTGDGAFFIKQGCFGCHSIQAYGIKSPTEKGPDLTFAIDDVRVRFNQTLQEFIFDPSQSGTMSIIFSSKVILSDEEKWALIDKLTKANNEYKKMRQLEN
ncbi:MAG: cytochrome c [candidate division Zixibacteria bacterium]|nr:cytochrome c [candidate division Zixibacteria bacterium]